MKQINKNDDIFNNTLWIKDKNKFSIICKIKESDTALIYSDGENYIIARDKVGHPTWIWTKDNIDINTLKEIEEVMKYYFTDEEKIRFTSKKEFYDLLIKDNFEYINKEDYFELGFLQCNKTKEPKKTDGFMIKLTEQNLEELADYRYKFNYEIDKTESKEDYTYKDALEHMKEVLSTSNIYAWKNENDENVCYAYMKEVDGQARICSVYTKEKHRGKGYAANLIYNMTNIALEKKLIPLLYTDYKYIPSNRAYKNAGYEDMGVLINFTCFTKAIQK